MDKQVLQANWQHSADNFGIRPSRCSCSSSPVAIDYLRKGKARFTFEVSFIPDSGGSGGSDGRISSLQLVRIPVVQKMIALASPGRSSVVWMCDRDSV